MVESQTHSKWKKSDNRIYTVWFYLCHILEKQNYSDKPTEECMAGWGVTAKWQEGIFQGDGNVLYVTCDGGYAIVYIFRKKPNCTHKISEFHCMKMIPQSWFTENRQNSSITEVGIVIALGEY